MWRDGYPCIRPCFRAVRCSKDELQRKEVAQGLLSGTSPFPWRYHLLLLQDENSSHILGDKVVGISLVDTVVANLSEPVVLIFFHNRLPVGGEGASLHPTLPGTEGEGKGGSGPVRLKSAHHPVGPCPQSFCTTFGIFWGFATCTISRTGDAV